MSKERELLESAIEYLYDLQGAWLWKENEVAGNGEEYNDLDNLVIKIREHLSQPEQNKPEVIMPNGVCVSNVYDAYEEGRKSVMSEQEPVAWKVIDETNKKFMFSRVKPTERSYKYDVVIPLYTAPPKREPLSSIKILELTSKHEYAINLIRAVEKAHGIGGGE